MYRNPQLLTLAKEAPCQSCGAVKPSDPAHANWQEFGKGMGLKAHDWAVAYLCRRCHNLVDGKCGRLTQEEAKDLWMRAWIKTLAGWFKEGVL